MTVLKSAILVTIFGTLVTVSHGAFAQQNYVECSDDFLSRTDGVEAGNIYYKFLDSGWKVADLTNPNVLQAPNNTRTHEIEIIHLTDSETSTNYHIVNVARQSSTLHPNVVYVSYGDELKMQVKASKRFKSPPFDKNKAQGRIKTQSYQEGHLNDQPVRNWRTLFDNGRGWHLHDRDGFKTFNPLTVRNAIAFPDEYVATENGNQKYFLQSFIQRYNDAGFICVQRKIGIAKVHTKLMTEFLKIADESYPAMAVFEFQR